MLVVGLLWLALTAFGLWWATSAEIHPLLASGEGAIVDDAFDLLLVLAVPVMAFVLAMLGYSLWRFRAAREATAAPLESGRAFIWTWVAVSALLAVYVIVNPGLTGLGELEEAAASHELDVVVLAEQWHWTYTYPEYELTVANADELVLPVDTTVRFRVGSGDVIHSFWIPAFRIKVDALPGHTAVAVATPTVLGTFDDDPNLRVQCAELCGTGHARMRSVVRVVPPDEFRQWVDEQLAEQGR